MTSSLAHLLLADERASTLRRSDRAVLEQVARLAGADGRPRYPVRHKTLAEKAGYSLQAVRRSLRRLSGRDHTRPDLVLVAVEPGTGHESSRYTVALSWDSPPPAFLPREQPAEAVPERPKAVPEPRTRFPREALAAIAPHGGQWLPEPPPPVDDEDQGDVVELLAPPTEDRDTWCEDARRIGRPHTGRRCCGMTARQLKEREEIERRMAARRRAAAEFTAAFGPEARARATPAEEAPQEYRAVRAALRSRGQSA